MPLPTIAYQTIPLNRDDVGDLRALVRDLLALPALAPRPDARGNVQGVVRLDSDGAGGYVVTFPADVDPAVVRTAIAAHDPTPPPRPPDARVADALAAIDDLDPKTATPEQIANAVNQIKAVVEAALAPRP